MSKGDSAKAMAKHSYRTATVAVIETEKRREEEEEEEEEDGSLQLAPGGVSLTGTKQVRRIDLFF